MAISGSNLTGASAVSFNATAAPGYHVDSDTQITATVPAGATSGPISVTTPGGTATSAGSFTVVPAPTIASFSPSSGKPGRNVTITGANLTGVTAVAFNGSAAAGFAVKSPTQISATVPNGATSGPISVTTPGGTATSSASFAVK